MNHLFGSYIVVDSFKVCGYCDRPGRRLNYFMGDNRNHMQCAHCGYNFVSLHGVELDDIEKRGGFTYINMIPIKGEFPECRYIDSLH